MRSRRALAQAAVWGLGCLLLAPGCGPALSSRTERLVYPNGVIVFSRGGVCSSVQWQADNQAPCPLILHLPAGDLGPRELADPQVLQGRGWVAGFRDPAGGTTEYHWEALDNGAEKSFAQVTLNNGALVRVLARSTSDLEVGINATHVTLPATPSQLQQALGKPIRVEVHDTFQGRIE